ncbi:MAG: hypothetical protein KDA78_16070 [Planctomycetaceae bacterium]|nr:hypothetical protein [Planctomycetaceae bacterium]
MGKWSAFLISLIPAGLAGYLCFLLVTIGLPVVEDMSPIFWGPLGTGFLGCVMCLLAPFGIAIFAKSAPALAAAPAAAGQAASDEDMLDSAEELMSGEVDEFASDDDLVADDFDSDDEFDDRSSAFQTAEIASDEFSDEFDDFELVDEEEDDDDDLFA